MQEQQDLASREFCAAIERIGATRPSAHNMCPCFARDLTGSVTTMAVADNEVDVLMAGASPIKAALNSIGMPIAK